MARPSKLHFHAASGQYRSQINGVLFYFGSDKEQAVRAWAKQLASGRPKSAASDSVAGVVSQFLEGLQANGRAPRTIETYRERLAPWVAFVGPQRLVDSVTKSTLTAYPRRSRTGAIQSVRAVFRFALAEGLVDQDPFLDVRRPQPGVRDKPIDEATYKVLCRHAQTREAVQLFVLAWETGARPRELFAAEAANVDAAAKCLRFKVGKGGRGRVVYVPSRVWRLVECMAAKRRKGPLLVNSQGRPWTNDSSANLMDRVRRRAGLADRHGLNDFRHGFAHRRLLSGMDPLTLATLMGHSDVSMIYRVYGHLIKAPKHLRKALDE